jgi:hypothetical protein
MSYQKQIHDYLNGDLSPDEEKRLFDELSDNPVLREELAMQIKLQQTVQKDMAANAISPAATTAIFSALNFAVPQKTIRPSMRRRFGFASKTFGANAMMSALALAIALGSFIYILSQPSTSEIPANAQRRGTISLKQPVSVIENSIQNQNKTNILVQDADHSESKKQIRKPLDHSESAANSENAYHRTIPNEPMKVYFDIGKFSSVDYLTPTKIIGVADKGMIYYSDNGGKSWEIQTSGTSSDLSGINFIDTTKGIIVGSHGTILLTDDAGLEWRPIQSGINTNLITIRYATRDTIFACGAQGTILRSISGGESWEKLESGTKLSLFKLFFENGSNGFATGEHGITLETHNAGVSWGQKK